MLSVTKRNGEGEKNQLFILETESSEFDQGPNHLSSRDSLVVFRVARPPIVQSVKETHPMRSCRPIYIKKISLIQYFSLDVRTIFILKCVWLLGVGSILAS